jgi:hypothetical protein
MIAKFSYMYDVHIFIYMHMHKCIHTCKIICVCLRTRIGAPGHDIYETHVQKLILFCAYQILSAMPEEEDDPMAAYYSGSLFVLAQADAEVEAHPQP